MMLFRSVIYVNAGYAREGGGVRGGKPNDFSKVYIKRKLYILSCLHLSLSTIKSTQRLSSEGSR